ncbi:hypothetical protein ACHWQZ_G012505 [Mnemiopsis leidyi]
MQDSGFDFTELMETRQRLVHGYMQCGLDGGTGLVPYGECDSGDPLEASYRTKVLDIYPPCPANFDPAATKEICMPAGVKFLRAGKSACPEPVFHSFVITREDGSQKYGGCLNYWTEVTCPEILNSMQMLLDMYKEQLRCEKEPRFAHPDRFHSGPDTLLSPSTVDPEVTSLYMTKCIAIVIELPYVDFVRDYLQQLLQYSRTPDKALPLESYVYNLLYEVMSPGPGHILKVTAPFSILNVAMESSPLPLFDYSLEELYSYISPSTFVDMLTCLLLEHQVMLLSKDNQRLMLVAESLKCLIYPFEWDHVYVPIVPATSLDLIEAPVTYIMGLSANLSLEEQADICVLDIDNNRLTLPEDIPNLPYRDELVHAITSILVRPNSSQPSDPFSRLKLTTNFSSGDSSTQKNCGSSTFGQRRLNRPPKLKLIRQCNAELKDSPTNEEKSQHSSVINLTIRNLFLDHLCKMLQNYDKFVIYPLDRKTWDANRDNLDNFERDVFLCDQAEQNLTFLSRFLETHMFSSFVDSKILCSFNVASEAIAHFDSRIEELRKTAVDEVIKSPPGVEVRKPTGSAKTPSLSTGLVDIVCRPPIQCSSTIPIGETTPTSDFPILRSQLLLEHASDKTSASMSRKLLRQRSIKEAKAKLEHNSNSLTSPTVKKHFPLDTDDSFDRMMKAHADFTNQLLKDCKNKINRLLVLKMGPEAQGLGYDYVIRGVEENSMVGAICDLVERVWSHGLVIRDGKSALWNQLRRHLDRWKEKHPQCSPSSTGSTSEDDSLEDNYRTSGVFFRRSSQQTPNLPPEISTNEQLYIDINSIKNLRIIRTDTGRARAFIRLLIEKQCLQQYLELITSDLEVLSKRYKDYAFLRDEEKVAPFIKYLLTLSAVPFTCFTASFPNITIQYKLYIVNSNKFNAQSTANAWVLLTGEKGDTGVYGLPRGESIVSLMTRNLGELRSLRVGHDNSGLSPGWCLDHILVENVLNGHCTLFRCGGWLSRSSRDGSIERLLIGERMDRNEYRNLRNTSQKDRSPPRFPSSLRVDGTVKAQEMLATAVNSLVRHRYRSQESDGTLVALLCGPQGLVPALQGLLSAGLRPTSRFNRGTPLVWEFVHKVYLEVSEVNTCHPDQPAIQSFVKCVQLLMRPSCSSVGLDGKFQTLICLGVRDGVLHRWFYMMSQSLAASKCYDNTGIFKQDSMLGEIMGLLKILEDLSIPVDVSLIHQTER